MGRGSSSSASQSARGLLYGNRPRGQGPRLIKEGDDVVALAASAPLLPDDLFDDEFLFGDSRYDGLEWLNRFAREALVSDGFSDTVVEETIIDEIDKGDISSFTAKSWAEPHRGEPNYQSSLREGKAMKQVIDLYQESELPTVRITLSAAANRFALKVALGRLASGETRRDNYGWRELQALLRLDHAGGGKRLGINIPPGLLDR